MELGNCVGELVIRGGLVRRDEVVLVVQVPAGPALRSMPRQEHMRQFIEQVFAIQPGPLLSGSLAVILTSVRCLPTGKMTSWSPAGRIDA